MKIIKLKDILLKYDSGIFNILWESRNIFYESIYYIYT